MSNITSFLKKDLTLIRLLALAGVVISAYLSLKSFGGSGLDYCITGQECDIVNSSSYSRLLGIPVSIIGLIGYVLIIAVSFYSFTKRKKWNYLFYMSLIGAVFSLYLTYIELFKIQAICSFCLASLLIILAIFIMISSKKSAMAPGSSLSKIVILAVVYALVVVFGVSSIQSSQNILPASNTYQVQLAKHLGSIGAKMYGSYKCPHCVDQKNEFGSAFSYIEYVECNNRGQNAQPSLCFAKGIRAYPTWEIKGKFYQGLLNLSRLAELSGFKGEEQEKTETVQ